MNYSCTGQKKGTLYAYVKKKRRSEYFFHHRPVLTCQHFHNMLQSGCSSNICPAGVAGWPPVAVGPGPSELVWKQPVLIAESQLLFPTSRAAPTNQLCTVRCTGEQWVFLLMNKRVLRVRGHLFCLGTAVSWQALSRADWIIFTGCPMCCSWICFTKNEGKELKGCDLSQLG